RADGRRWSRHVRRVRSGQGARESRAPHPEGDRRAHRLGSRGRRRRAQRRGGLTVDRNLEGKTALVTGGSRGIGGAIALELGARGASVVVGARTREAAAATAEAITASGGAAAPLALDIADAASVESALGGLLKERATIPLLVNNAGITRDNLLMRM